MIHVVGRWQNTNDIRHATTNDSDQEGQRPTTHPQFGAAFHSSICGYLCAKLP